MNAEYRRTELQSAKRQYAIARTKWATAATHIGRRKWGEQMNFWSNKVAFLENVRAA